MTDTKILSLPMDQEQWEQSGIKQDGASLLTTIGLAEGEILNFIETKEEVTLTDLVNQLALPEPIIVMAIGVLVRNGLIDARKQNQFILLTNKI